MFQLHQELEEAARVSGASRVRAFQEIIIPLIVPAMLNVTIWVAAHSMRELSAALMLKTSQMEYGPWFRKDLLILTF